VKTSCWIVILVRGKKVSGEIFGERSRTVHFDGEDMVLYGGDGTSQPFFTR
jgi:hypothetical protein